MYLILIAEDDVMMQRVLRDTLKAEGFEVTLCPDGESALESTGREKPDLVVLDMNLPDMSGLDVCRRLKAETATRHIPVIVLTGEARETELRVASLAAGAEDYLFKPLGGKALLARIRAILKIAVRPV